MNFFTGSGEVTSYNVSGLSTDTQYNIQVVAISQRGIGAGSKVMEVTIRVPSIPTITTR